jgi:hypothetical protein
MGRFVGVATPIAVAFVVCSYVSRVIPTVTYFSTIQKNYSEPRTLYRDSNPEEFPGLWPWLLQSPSKRNIICLAAVVLLRLFSELQKTLSVVEPKTVFGVVAFVFIIFSSLQSFPVFMPFFCRP